MGQFLRSLLLLPGDTTGDHKQACQWGAAYVAQFGLGYFAYMHSDYNRLKPSRDGILSEVIVQQLRDCAEFWSGTFRRIISMVGPLTAVIFLIAATKPNCATLRQWPDKGTV